MPGLNELARKEMELMTKEHKEVLRLNRVGLVENMRLEGIILDVLKSKCVLDRYLYQMIAAKPTMIEKVQYFLDKIETMSDKAFTDLVDALEKSEQQHIAALLWMEDIMPTTRLTGEAIKVMKHWLNARLFIDPEFTFPECLMHYELLTYEATLELNTPPLCADYHKQNDFIIKRLLPPIISQLDAGQYAKFLKALEDTSQQHVVNYFQGDGSVGCYGDIRPLVNEIKYIDVCSYALTEYLHHHISDDFFGELLRTDCILEEHYSHVINNEKTGRRKLKKLLSILRRRSYKSWKLFIDAVESILNAPKLADFLKKGEVLYPGIHIKFDLEATRDSTSIASDTEIKSEAQANAVLGERSDIKESIESDKGQTSYPVPLPERKIGRQESRNVGEKLRNNIFAVKTKNKVLFKGSTGRVRQATSIELSACEEQLAKHAETRLSKNTSCTNKGISKTMGPLVNLRKGRSIELFMACRSLECALNMDEMYRCGFLQELYFFIFRELALDANIPLRPTALTLNQSHMDSIVRYFTEPLSKSENVQRLGLYHAYVVLQTGKFWWSVEKNDRGITLQRKTELNSVMEKLWGLKRV